MASLLKQICPDRNFRLLTGLLVCLAVLNSNAPASGASPSEEQTRQIRLLNQKGLTDEAAELLRSPGDPENALLNLLWAETHFAKGDTEKAREFIYLILKEESPAEWQTACELRVAMEYLEGDTALCMELCRQLLEHDPLSNTARLYIARLQIRQGQWDDAAENLSVLEGSAPGDLETMACRAEWWQAQGHDKQAQNLRQSVADTIDDQVDTSPAALCMAASAMRNIDRPQAALQSIQCALEIAPADPFILLEKARLFRETTSYGVAASTLNSILKKYPRCALALEEFASVLWDLREDATAVSGLCNQALAIDPTLLDTRCRLVQYSLIARDWEQADGLIAINRAVNPHHRETEDLARVKALLTEEDDTPGEKSIAVQLLLGQILAEQSDFSGSLNAFRLALGQDKTSRHALKGAGLASLRSGAFSEAAVLLESAFSASTFDIATRNTLSFIDQVQRSHTLSQGQITVAYSTRDELLGTYTLASAHRFLQQVSLKLGIRTDKMLRIQLCPNDIDLEVLTQGLPSTSCGSLPLGTICMGSTIYVKTPGAVVKEKDSFRLDEALYLGMVNFLFSETFSEPLPRWMQEGFARHMSAAAHPEWQPLFREQLISLLRAGYSVKLEQLNAEFLGNKNPLCRAYSAMVFDFLIERHGFETVLNMLQNVAQGKEWVPALEAMCAQSIDGINQNIHESVLARFQHLGLEPQSMLSAKALLESDIKTDSAMMARAAFYLRQHLLDNAMGSLRELIHRDTPPTRALCLAARVELERGNPVAAHGHFQVAQALETMRGEMAITAMDYEALGRILTQLGKEEAALQAFRKSIDLNPLDATEHGAYGKLLDLLHRKNPVPMEYYQILQQRLPARRADAPARMELARWYQEQGQLEEAVHYYQSAVGLRPDWISAHRTLAALALQLGDHQTAYVSNAILHKKRPVDKRVRESLLLCARALGYELEVTRLQALSGSER
jgi:tetratricopeptide (TPR) repeat protein